MRANGSAWEAGVRQNDILLSLDGAPLAKPEDLEVKLKDAAQKAMALAIVRKGKTMTLSVYPKVNVSLGPVPQEQTEYWIGLAFGEVDPVLRAQLDIPREAMMITEVYPNSPAAKNGVKANDVILSFGQDEPNGNKSTLRGDQENLYRFIQRNGGKELRMDLLRDGARTSVKLTPEKRQPIQVKVTGIRHPFAATSTVVRPGLVQIRPSIRTDEQVPRWDVQTFRLPKVESPDASAKRLDEMASEIKALRKAVDDLLKAIEERK